MCESVLLFADHDLPMNSADDCIKEFAGRTKSNIILTDCSETTTDITRVHFSDDKKIPGFFPTGEQTESSIKFFQMFIVILDCSFVMVNLK